MAFTVVCLRSSITLRENILFHRNLIPAVKYFSDDSEKKDNLYKTLGISTTATSTEIKKAYYDLTLKFHPDRNENSDFAATKFREVAEAYEILGNYGLRKKYDKGIPLSIMKTVTKPTVPHDVKYQAFYDSRAVQSPLQFEKENTEYFNQKRLDPHAEHVKHSIEKHEKELKMFKSNGITLVISMFIGVMFLVFRYA